MPRFLSFRRGSKKPSDARDGGDPAPASDAAGYHSASGDSDPAAERSDSPPPQEVLDDVKSFDVSSLRPASERELGKTDEDGDAAAAPGPKDAAGGDVRRVVAASRAARVATVADDVDAPEEVHGFKFADRRWAPAVRVVSCDEDARPGYTTRKAHEYLETPETLAAKVAALADMVRSASHCVAYTGAGISTASGIGDYASRSSESLGAGGSRPKLRSPLQAEPTLAHHVLTQMYKAGMMEYWIQQNHDGLPQKAGFPQAAINEIHGAWFDPSNPVVPMSGSLRTDLFEDLLEWELRADLVLAMGSSLCGMNADRVATTCAERALTGDTSVQGTVIVSLQRTQYDNISALRIYAKIDDVMKALAKELGIRDAVRTARRAGSYLLGTALKSAGISAGAGGSSGDEGPEVFKIPYNPRTGKLAEGSETMTLDLRPGARVRLTGGMYEGDEGEVTGRGSSGCWNITFKHNVNKKRSNKKVPFVRVLGPWWAEAAVRGAVPIIPVVNVRTTRRPSR